MDLCYDGDMCEVDLKEKEAEVLKRYRGNTKRGGSIRRTQHRRVVFLLNIYKLISCFVLLLVSFNVYLMLCCV